MSDAVIITFIIVTGLVIIAALPKKGDKDDES